MDIIGIFRYYKLHVKKESKIGITEPMTELDNVYSLQKELTNDGWEIIAREKGITKRNICCIEDISYNDNNVLHVNYYNYSSLKVKN